MRASDETCDILAMCWCFILYCYVNKNYIVDQLFVCVCLCVCLFGVIGWAS